MKNRLKMKKKRVIDAQTPPLHLILVLPSRDSGTQRMLLYTFLQFIRFPHGKIKQGRELHLQFYIQGVMEGIEY